MRNYQKIIKLLGFLLLILFSLIYIYWMPYKFPWITFWLLIILWIIFIIYQIITCTDTKCILALISIVVSISLIRVLLRPYGITLWGGDPYIDYAVAYKIYTNGWNPSAMIYPTNTFHTDFPIIHIFGIISSEILDVELFTIVKWLPIIISISSIVFIYLLTINIYESEKAGLIACFLFSFLYNFVEFHSSFVKENIGFVFFLGSIYSYIQMELTSNKYYKPLIILFSIITIISHHLTSLLLILLLTLYITNKYMIKILINQRKNILKYETTIILLISICAIGYWTYLKYSPLEWIVKSLELPRLSTLKTKIYAPAEQLRYLVLKIKDFIFGLIIGLFAIYSALIDIKKIYCKRIITKITFLFFGAIMGFLSIVYTQFVPILGRGTIWGGRFMTFGYFTLSILSANSISNFLSLKRNNNIKVLIITFLIVYPLLQIYSIPPSLYTYTKYPYEIDGGRYYILPSEQMGISWFTGSGKVVTPDWILKICKALWIVEGRSIPNIRGVPNFNNIVTISNQYDYMLLILSDTNTKSISIYLNKKALSKIYDTGKTLAWFYITHS